MTEISHAQAKAIADAAVRLAPEHGLVALTVVVTDIAGQVRVAERNDAAPPYGVAIATAKARTALGFRRPTIKTGAIFGEKPAVVTGLNAAVGGDFLPLGGGVPVTDGPGGAIIGAAAVAGGLPEKDHAVVVAAVLAAGLASPE